MVQLNVVSTEHNGSTGQTAQLCLVWSALSIIQLDQYPVFRDYFSRSSQIEVRYDISNRIYKILKLAKESTNIRRKE